MPTFEMTLSALELDFDRQLAAVMDNLFGDEFASLHDLEPIATTTTPLTCSETLEASLFGGEPTACMGSNATLTFEDDNKGKNTK